MRRGVLSFAIFALLLQACGGTTPASTTAPSQAAGTAAVTQQRVVKLFGINPLTGTSANAGQRAQGGMEIAAKEINAAGGVKDAAGNVYTFEISRNDMANDRTEAIALLRKAAGDSQILAVVGPSSSVGFVPMVPVAGQLEMPVISVGAGAPLTEWNIFAYRTNPSGIEPVRATLKAVVPLVKAKRVAVIYESTQDAMVSDFNGVKTVAAELGYEVVANQSFKVGDQDFSAQITAVAAATPDLIYVAGSTEAAKVVQQIRAKGVTTAVAGGYGTLADTLFWDNSGGATKGAYTWLPQDFSKPSAPVGKLFTAYKQAYNDEGSANTMYGYDAVYAVAEAVKKSGSATDRKKLATALSSVDFTTPLGTRISWKNPPNGDLTNPSIGIYRVVERGVLERVDK